ncbi:MAG: hypothetical protein KIT80_16125 [Chitinophagaceae bacterium]|nr:hypothetical protein [Chitinophagaceae bacterium]MCW5928444.1 hypothetical protein [Chitinophagaceae bacterium]
MEIDKFTQGYIDTLWTTERLKLSTTIATLNSILSKYPDPVELRRGVITRLMHAFTWRAEVFDRFPSDEHPEEPGVSEKALSFLLPHLHETWRIKPGGPPPLAPPHTIQAIGEWFRSLEIANNPSLTSTNINHIPDMPNDTETQIVQAHYFLSVYKEETGYTNIENVEDLKLLYQHRLRYFQQSHPGATEADFKASETLWIDKLFAENDIRVRAKKAADNALIYRRLVEKAKKKKVSQAPIFSQPSQFFKKREYEKQIKDLLTKEGLYNNGKWTDKSKGWKLSLVILVHHLNRSNYLQENITLNAESIVAIIKILFQVDISTRTAQNKIDKNQRATYAFIKTAR